MYCINTTGILWYIRVPSQIKIFKLLLARLITGHQSRLPIKLPRRQNCQPHFLVCSKILVSGPLAVVQYCNMLSLYIVLNRKCKYTFIALSGINYAAAVALVTIGIMILLLLQLHLPHVFHIFF